MLLSDMEEKDVINVIDGACLGNICDLEIEPNSGQIVCIYVQSIRNILNIFNKNERIVVAWDQIVKIGEDVIIVNYPYYSAIQD